MHAFFNSIQKPDLIFQSINYLGYLSLISQVIILERVHLTSKCFNRKKISYKGYIHKQIDI